VEQVCIDGAFTPCVGPDEVCNAFNDDCDGRVDESADGAPLQRVCYRGAPGTQGVGVCATGVEVCEGGLYGLCLGQVTPLDEACNTVDDDCDGVVDESSGGLALASACYDGPAGTDGVGICRAGIRVCQDGVAGACQDEALPTAEICDGLDNDCNGVVDDAAQACDCAPDEERPCYSGAAETLGVGRCAAGVQGCDANGRFGACVGEVAPERESCDGVDQDCDGAIDEQVEGVGDTCVGGRGACAAQGEVACDSATGTLTCVAELGQPTDEVCNLEDDDCDGVADEGFSLGTACEVGVGACAAQGALVCGPAGDALCDAVARLPSVEVCNGRDDDCDDSTDEGLRVGEVCSSGVGACQRFGALSCDPDGGVVCTATPGGPGQEVCNGADDDCDGQVDEAFPEAGAACDTGLPGLCADGARVCERGALACAQRVRPAAETCNGLDDDCDGAVDLDGVGAPLVRDCYTGPANTSAVGQCRTGRSVCRDAQFGRCDGEVLPTVEVCNGADDDCDGAPDDVALAGGCACAAGSARPCYQGPAGTQGVGICQAGVQVCAADGSGYGACLGQVTPGAEACNGLDDDCDGQLDDVAGVGVACTSGQGVCAAAGTFVCDAISGALVCDGVPRRAGVEVCNGLDDDCDGTLDDVAGVGDACRVGADAQGCAAAGTRRCVVQGGVAPVCVASPPPGIESCNGRDDDNDLCTDEGDLPGTGIACTSGTGACLRAGVTVCGGAGIVCGAVAGAASPELCNGADDNCNGTVDDAPSDVGGACSAGVGACQRAGVFVCNGGARACTAVAGAASVERCNGADDDCDGQIDEGGVCDVFASCKAARAAGRGASGVYRVSAGGGVVDVYCDQTTDGGGWTLVGSTRTGTLNDQSANWYADLTTLAPANPNTGVWSGLRDLSASHDVRFACRDALGAEAAPMTVDLSFYQTIWYTEWTTGADADSCFSENDGAGDDVPQPARRNNLTGEQLALGTPWQAVSGIYSGNNYLEGEDSCGDTSDFTVDLRDRGMDSEQSDGTDWGEDDGALKCGRSGLADGQWFVFTREVAPPDPGAGLACPADDGFEQNDAQASARGVVAAPNFSGDAILCGTDDDWFAVTLQAACTYRIQLDFTHARGDIDLALYDASSAELDSSAGITNSEVIDYVVGAVAQRVFIEVTGWLFDAASANGYRLTVTRVSCP